MSQAKKPQLFLWHKYELVTQWDIKKWRILCILPPPPPPLHTCVSMHLSGHGISADDGNWFSNPLPPPSCPPPSRLLPTGGWTDIRGGQGSLAMLTPFNFQDAAERGEEEVGADHFHLRRRSRKDTIYTKGGRQQEADRGGVGELQKSLSTNSMGIDGSFHKISVFRFLRKSRLENEASPVTTTTTSMELSITQPKYTLFFPLRLLVGDACGGCAMRWSGEGEMQIKY